jgi:glucose/arabinose dehydrogenase
MNRQVLVFFSILIVMVIASACTVMPENQLPPRPSPPVTAITDTGTPPDLTNRYSPLAAGFTGSASTTLLGTPGARIGLEKIADGFSSPLMIAVPPDKSGRMFLVDQTGVVRIITPGKNVSGTPFLDVRDRMVSTSPFYDERGLLSLAFHPDYKNNGRIFVFYSAPPGPATPAGWSCTNRLSEFRVMAGNPDRVDMTSEKVLLTIDKPYQNHNGGPLLFGPDDGYLYLGLGDGGRADDTGTGHTPGTGNAQDMQKLLGKIIRIDVDTPPECGKHYTIPPDNPFISTAGYAPEIFASGFRNPAYASFDAAGNHSLFSAVAGQALFESVFIVDKGGNYGCNIREGTHCFNPSDDTHPAAEPCPVTGSHGEPLIGPIIETGHDVGNVIVGGYVYRGSALPGLAGKYFFGEWSTGFLRGDGSLYLATPPGGDGPGRSSPAAGALAPRDNRMWTIQEVTVSGTVNGRVNAFVTGFGEDADHELYVLTSEKSGPDPAATTGAIWKLVPP